MYSQTNPIWSNISLDGTQLHVGGYGCYGTNIANMLTYAGYRVDPGMLFNALNSNGGINSNGLIIHAKVTEAYPQFRYDSNGSYQMIPGILYGRYNHFVCKMSDGTIVDPLTGNSGMPSGFNADHQIVNGAIVPSSPQNVTVDQAPSPTPQPAPSTFNVTVNNTCNVRTSPSPSAGITSVLQPGNTFTGVAKVIGSMVSGNDIWIKSSFGHFVWSGNLSY